MDGCGAGRGDHALRDGAAEAQIRLRYAHVGVANAPQTLYAEEVAKLVKERTNGRVEIQVFANSQLGGVAEMVGRRALGRYRHGSPRLRFSRTHPAEYGGVQHTIRLPRRRALAPCDGLPHVAGARRDQQGVGREGQHAHRRIVLPGHAAPDIEGARADAGRRARQEVPGRPVKLWSSMLTGMGAIATPVEVSELATALATGSSSARRTPCQHPQPQAVRGAEVRDDDGPYAVGLSVFVNERVWQGVPAADRKIIEDTMAEVGLKTLAWDKENNDRVRKELESRGMTFVEEKDGLDVAAFRRAVLEQIGKDFPEWKDLIAQIQAVQ